MQYYKYNHSEYKRKYKRFNAVGNKPADISAFFLFHITPPLSIDHILPIVFFERCAKRGRVNVSDDFSAAGY